MLKTYRKTRKYKKPLSGLTNKNQAFSPKNQRAFSLIFPIFAPVKFKVKSFSLKVRTSNLKLQTLNQNYVPYTHQWRIDAKKSK